MKIVAKSKNGKMLKIGEDEKTAKWFFMTESVQGFVEKTAIVVGDEVDFQQENKNGSFTITNIVKKGQSGSAAPAKTTDSGITSNITKNYGKSDKEQDSIKKQAIIKACADAVKSLTGKITKEELPDYMVALYDKLLAKVNE
jgi:hypothetical protein